MADLLKILEEGQALKPQTSTVDTGQQDEREIASLSPQIKQAEEVAQRTEVICVVRDELVEGGNRLMNSEGVVKLERVQVTCPACGQQVEAVGRDGEVRGYCAVARQSVDFLIETQRVRIGKNPTAETKAKISASVQDPEVKDAVVRDYLRGAKTIVIQLEYKISPGVMYRILHTAHVKLRTGDRRHSF